MRRIIVLFAAALALSACAPAPTMTEMPPPTSAAAGVSDTEPAATPIVTEELSNVLFDDFQYSTQDEMAANGWIVRAKPGWPGVSGATFRPENVSFVQDTVVPGNFLLRMESSTDGTSAGTFQTQICHRRKYLEGTYAARVRFTNSPTTGPDGDQIVETFYAITPYEKPMDPDYSEMDFEYLPNGAWGLSPTTFAFTTWETAQIEPWQADNASDSIVEDNEGWRTLTAQAHDGTVRYFVSGKLVAEHGGKYYPDSPMSINFNLWFVEGGLAGSRENRAYQEDIDWVFFEAGVLLSPEQVNRKMLALRSLDIGFVDQVPETTPALESPCDL